MNLCTNAYYAMRRTGGVLNVSLKQVKQTSIETLGKTRFAPNSYLELKIQDTGCGMPDDTLEKIFEPYFTTKAKGEGTGLGLALVQSIILDFGGDISVNSKLGRGTIFRIYLPTIHTVKESCHQEKDRAPLPTGCEHILVVDDDMNFAQMNKKILESLGYEVSALTDSIAAFNRFQRTPEAFDLVLTDMTMPQMTGDELSRQMLALRSDLPVILCTGFSELIDEKRAADIGIYNLVMKPFTKRELAKTVRAALDQKKGCKVP
ncbi:MAG: response regulator [Candidatus Electrothrix sp. AR3]|nr:response regulator [Candidatus Electrothrix sp. AR3]